MRLAYSLLALVFFSADAEAQRRGHAFAKEGDLALAIGLVGLDDLALRPLDGGIGLRYRVADRTVVGASLGLSFSDREQETRTDNIIGEDSESDALSTSFSLWTERHIGGSRVVSPFVGMAGRVRLSQTDSRSTTTPECDPEVSCPPYSRRAESESIVVGGGMLLGAEVRLARGVTLGGAYTLGAEYSRYEDTYAINNAGLDTEQRREGSGWRYGVGTTQVSLSVYF